MTRYILDTDHVTLSQHGNSKILKRSQMVGSSNIFVTSITFEEQLRGRLDTIRKCGNNSQSLSIAYRNLLTTQRYYCRINLLDFDEAAYLRYQELQQQKIKIGTQDLRIASIALAHQAFVVTRNYKDFSKVPDLTLEDWTLEEPI
ncbi:MAG TPA: type II toxin-antitoxin system VapC family toxin [Nostocaceae cyanobacterium]|nr:type II toxin-antitoxin system VapC family toxin [Nostocaceae cyanobacterium]